MADFRDCLQIRTHAIITRAHQKQRLAIGILLKSFSDSLRRNRPLYCPCIDHLRQNIYRFCPGQNQPHQRRFMRISRHHDLLALTRCAEDHSFIPARTPIDKKKTLIRLVEHAKQALRFTDCTFRAVQIVRQRRLCHIVCKHCCSYFVRPARTDSLIQSVPGYPEICRICLNQFRDRFQQWCLILIHSLFPFVNGNSIDKELLTFSPICDILSCK